MTRWLSYNSTIYTKNSRFKGVVCLILCIVFSCSSPKDSVMQLQVTNFPNRSLDFSLWQLEPFIKQLQMGYILKTDDNKVILVDGGGEVGAPFIENYIKQLGGSVDTWIITHGHMDHMGALLEILDKKTIDVKRLIHAPLSMDWVLKHEPVSKGAYARYLTSIHEADISIMVPENFTKYALGKGVMMEFISIGNHDIAHNGINNSSLVFRITSKSKSVLFLGDLGIEGGQRILGTTQAEKLKADYVQMAHHGQHGVDKDFYKAVGAKYALWPTPDWLWENRADGKGDNTGNFKTLEVRKWMKELNIKKNYVSGLEGTIQID